MKKLVFCIIFLHVSAFVYPQLMFERTFGGANSDGGRSVIQTKDEGYAILGFTVSFGVGKSDIYLIKTNAYGDTIWTRTYGGNEDESGYQILQLSNGEYILCGYTNSYGAGQTDAFFIKTDPYGNVVWAKTYGGTENDFGGKFIQTSDSGFFICGSTKSYGSGSSDIYLIRTDKNGDTLWTKTYGGVDWDYAGPVIQTFDGGFLIAGEITYSATDNVRIELFHTDQGGNILWTKYYQFCKWNHPSGLIQTNDGGYIISGSTYDEEWNPFLLKVDINGDSTWTKTYQWINSGVATSVFQDINGDYLIAGHTEDVFLVKTNTGGDTLWTRTFGNQFDDYGFDLVGTKDGGFIITGFEEVSDGGPWDVLLIKTNASGIVGIDETYESLKNGIIAYPNPTKGKITIEHNSSNNKYELYDATGNILIKSTPFNLKFEIDLSKYSNGIYFLTLGDKGGKVLRKIVKE
ncbi:MAG: T9SS type A sorting domain-containing protein [Bacteroidota bacterium]